MGSSSARSLLASELRALVFNAAQGKPSFATFLSRLESAGVRVTTHVSANAQKVQGLSFHLDGSTFKASSLDRKLSWDGLRRKLGGQYDATKDFPLVLARAARKEGQTLEGSAWSQETVREPLLPPPLSSHTIPGRR